MYSAECPFCDHVNPTASKYCNACGGPLYLSMCPHCNALNDNKATACYKCEGALAVTETHALAAHSTASEASVACESAAQPASSESELCPDESWEPDRVLLGSQPPNPAQPRLVSRLAHALSPSATFAFAGSRWRPVVSKTLPRQWSIAALGGIVLAAAAGFGVYAYYSQSAVEVRQAPAASGTPTVAAPSVAAATDQDNAAPAAADEDKNIIQERIDREGAASARSAAVVPAPVPHQNDDVVTAAGRQPPQSAPCTEIVAALGLCSPQSVQGK
jgi:hypothetical protein